MGNSSSSNEQQSVDNNEDINTHVSNEEEQEEYSDSYWVRINMIILIFNLIKLFQTQLYIIKLILFVYIVL